MRVQALILCTIVLAAAQGASAAIVTVDASEAFAVRRNTGTASLDSLLHPKQVVNKATTDRLGMIRFDSAAFGAGVLAATFEITARSDTGTQFQGTFDFTVYGVQDLDPQDEAIDQGTYNPNAAGAVYDHANDPAIDANQLELLGTFQASAGDQVMFTDLDLLSWIQGVTNGIVTLVITRVQNGGNSVFENESHETDNPKLVVTVVPTPASAAMGLMGMVMLALRRQRS